MMECGTSLFDTVCRSLKDIINSGLAHEQPKIESIPLKQKTKDLKYGDIILPWFIKAKESEAKKMTKIPRMQLVLDSFRKRRLIFEAFGKLVTSLLQFVEEKVREKTLPVSKVCQDRYNILSFHLDRPTVTREVLKEVHTQGVKYGHCSEGQGCLIMLNPMLDDYSDEKMTESPIHMRMFYILTHLKRLIEGCGYQVCCVERLLGEKALTDSHNVGKDSSSPNGGSSTENFIASAKILSSQYTDNGDMDDGEISLKSIMDQKHFSIGKDGLDKNLNKVEVFASDGKVTQLLKDTAVFDNRLGMDRTKNNILHIVPQGKLFRLQQMILLQAGLSQKELSQSHLTIGPVICKGDITMEHFQRSRFEQMKEASEMRHGIKCEGPEWTARIEQLSQSGIKFEVLGTALHCPLKMDTQSSHSTENRLGAFVLYNAARLATILRQFSLSVQNGTYPPLPSIADINFGLLREQEEWELVYLYVAYFPNVVRESVEVLFPGQGKLSAKIHTHRITNFLISFSKSLSSYYSRYHILGGSESHLLPRMFARLHLVQACHRVICNGLALLDIQPLEEL